MNSTISNNKNNLPDVTFKVAGNTTRVITLNRPKKLNALSTSMCSSIAQHILEYNKSQVNSSIIINSSNSPRSFCSGGDVAQVALDNLQSKKDKSVEFFQQEYSLNNLIATSNRPIITIMDGIVMGGGVGLTTHAPIRIATENTKWCMPEMDIGFFPDVGVTFSLPKQATVGGSRGQLPLYLCLTGDVLNGIDTYLSGFATHYINSHNLPDLQARLGELSPPNNSDKRSELMGFSKTVEEFTSSLPHDYKFKYTIEQLDVIEEVFSIDSDLTLITLYDRLKKVIKEQHNTAGATFASSILQKLTLEKSQISIQVAIEQFKRNMFAPRASAALKQDLITASNFCYQSSLNEFTPAVKHKLIDKIRDKPYEWKLREPLSNDKLAKLLSQTPSSNTELLEYNSLENSSSPRYINLGLPTEADVAKYIKGEDNSNRTVVPTNENIISYFTKYGQGSSKIGCKYLLQHLILPRKCNTDKYTRTVQWKEASKL
ncbi:related to 3-hydroxyisobutyryl-CoA hydrolase, mitochondrial [Saccharomycodes ludwigii]|uniref:3-hydroxyisobutyryl-CoA hydrolase n=2 Tax=Saccharomycodes ludwigii TaxID=36035 RepID=A0A376B563_9ASCO|nr:related to 3-hydroxyisobutyryl-CoA hydrolase, mitochondrial [Saccharomycodes ludwigii]